MQLHLPTLLFAAAVALLVASAASSAIGLRQRARRGIGAWTAANVLLAAALGLHGFGSAYDWAAPLAAALALQWPIVTLAGVRRFFSRGTARLPAWADWLVLGAAVLAATAGWLAAFEPAQVLAGASIAVTLYTAWIVRRLDDYSSTSTLKTLLATLLGAALLQAAWLAALSASLVPGFDAADVSLGALLGPALAALLMTQIALVMNHERHVAHLRTAQRKLRHRVDVDDLTQLPNRRHFHELAERAVKAAQGAATVLVFDIDGLKRLNELLGHANGDEALRQLGTALRETLRRRDVAGRLGGDEFGVVLPRTRAVDADKVIARIRGRLDDRQIAPRIARVAVNVGCVEMTAGETLVAALRRAENQLEARRSGATAAAEPAATAAAASGAEEAPAPALPYFIAPQATPVRNTRPAELNAIPVGEVVMGSAG